MGGPRSEERSGHSLERIRAVGARINECALVRQQRWNLDVLDFLELRLMVLSAEAIVLSASFRRESRGAHVWEGKPEQDPVFAGKRTKVTLQDGTMAARWELVS
jgi:succinate dehydrogenase/fumarate reductase flavoprotein subunit